jgi:hypothetical protein
VAVGAGADGVESGSMMRGTTANRTATAPSATAMRAGADDSVLTTSTAVVAVIATIVTAAVR